MIFFLIIFFASFFEEAFSRRQNLFLRSHFDAHFVLDLALALNMRFRECPAELERFVDPVRVPSRAFRLRGRLKRVRLLVRFFFADQFQ